MTERSIQKMLKQIFINHEYLLFNAYVYAWESDFFAVSKSNYAVEVEIKVSRSDFKNDFKNKQDKHTLLVNAKQEIIVRGRLNDYYQQNYKIDNIWYKAPYSCISYRHPQKELPNKFYYAVPHGLISMDECPAYAGLIYISDHSFIEMKKAPFLHKQKNDLTKVLLDKFHWKSKNLKLDIALFLNDVEYSFSEEERQKISGWLSKFKSIV